MEGDSRSSTIKTIMPPEPIADGDVDAQVLIKEARARARRRRRRLALVLAVLLALIAGVAAAVRSPSGKVATATARRDHSRSPAFVPLTLPPFFADVQGSGEGNGPLQIRETGSGHLVWQDTRVTSADGVTGLAAASQRSFVFAMNAGSACATKLYRARLSASGLPGALAPLGPTLPGMLWSLTVGDDGRVIGYAISGCSKGAPGYLGVLQLPSGRTREWGDLSLGGMSSGNLALQGQLTMSADGRLLGFAADAISQPDGLIMGQNVRVLATDAPPGSVSRRSRVIYRQAAPGLGTRSDLAAASLSPSGTSAYVCRQSATRTLATAEIMAYSASTADPRGVITTFNAKGTWPQVSCSSMALDSSGGFLLVPYTVHSAAGPSAEVLQQVAVINLATRAIFTVPIKMSGSGGISEENGTSIVAW
jgi:hypothetical protein